ncbi:MAG: hypothetical protein V5A64_02600 [Candidatus Thermoplasmatota archaeon]
MNIIEKTGDQITEQKNHVYMVNKKSDRYILKEIKIEKKPLKYAFIGGMYYTHNKLNFKDENISLPYPFSTYYLTKIPDITYKDRLCRSLYYCKLPIILLQFQDEAISIEFKPTIKTKKEEVNPFISIDENQENYLISFYLFTEFIIKEKKHAWLGKGKKTNKKIEINEEDSFRFPTKIKKHENWRQPIRQIFEKNIKDTKPKNPASTYRKAKKALCRSYDHITGSFLQLPWRDSTGFALAESSYSLLSYEAVRLHYFSKWYKEEKDEELETWINKLKKHFIDPQLYKTQLKEGEGLVWYNMTNLTSSNKLRGYFYMGCGYGGYPGGQGTTTYHLLKYLQRQKDTEVEEKVKRSLRYIISTQNKDGSWPMAINQEGIILRPEKLQKHISYGGTSECIKALLAGYHEFNEEQLKESALKALEFLMTKNPICYNGLRDIAVQEPEAFSAMSIIESFLDAYDFFSEKKYLLQAEIYAYYALTWIYLYNTEKLDLKWGFHPISRSITPRLSPYESIYMVSVFKRLHETTEDKFWEKLAYLIYNHTKRRVTSNGGLSEGVFPRYLQEQKTLPMEQTFATVELMNASKMVSKKHIKNKKEEKRNKNFSEKIEVEKQGEKIVFNYDDETILVFNTEKCKITYIKNTNLNRYGISISFDNPYKKWNIFRQKTIKKIRGKYGKYVLGIRNIDYFIKGVHPPKNRKQEDIIPFEKINKKNVETKIDGNKTSIQIETIYHKITLHVTIYEEKNSVEISFNPVKIEVLDHDIFCSKVLFPVVGSKLLNKKGEKLYFEGFTLEINNNDVISKEDYTAIDQTKTTNWTHGGIFKEKFKIKIKK